MLIDCSDSRVNEQEIFSAQPGTLFTAANIANRFDENDLNAYDSLFQLILRSEKFLPVSNAVLSFAVESLKVKHIIVLGHYGCGGVAASMIPFDAKAPRPTDVAVQTWISPIRHIYQTSSRYPFLVLTATSFDSIVPFAGKRLCYIGKNRNSSHFPSFLM